MPAYTLDQLRSDVKAGLIDTVLVAFPDMQGRLIGKRFQAEFFLDGAIEETHGCDYLLANDIDMEPVPGYAAANWGKGYGDFVMKPDISTLMKCSRACGWATRSNRCHAQRKFSPVPKPVSPITSFSPALRAAKRSLRRFCSMNT